LPSLETKSSTIKSCLPFNDGTNEIQELTALYIILSPTNSPKTIVHAPQPPSEHPSLGSSLF